MGYGITDAVDTSLLGASNGVATLDSSGLVPLSQIPSALVGAVVYTGTWNASINSPALVSGSGVKGNYYVVSTAGTTTIDGISSWASGDIIIYNGTTWNKIDGSPNAVTSVAGRIGAITLTAADIGGLAASATVDTTNASNITLGTLNVGQLPAFTGDVSSISGSNTLTLATSGVTAATVNGSATSVTPITVNAKGLVTGTGTPVTITPAFGNITGTPTTLSGYGITDAQPALTFGDMASFQFSTTTTTAGQVIDSVSAAVFRTVKYLVQATSGTSYQSQEIIVIQDGTTSYNESSNLIQTGALLATFDTQLVSGNLQLLVTPVNAATTINAVRISLNV